MKITKQQFEKIKHVFPKSRGSVQIDHFAMINILLYVVENGYKWRALPKEFGNWHTGYNVDALMGQKQCMIPSF